MSIPLINFEERLQYAKDNVFASLAHLNTLVKQRGEPDEITAAALVWLTRLRWAVEDAYEFKTRQMATNPAEEAQPMLGPFLTLLEALTTEIKQMIAILETHAAILPSLMAKVNEVGIHIQPQFYHC
jgi:hypothetical protein